MAMKVTARTSPLTAVQNHSDPGPMNDIPSVLTSFTSAPFVLLPRWADDTERKFGGQECRGVPASGEVQEYGPRAGRASRPRTGGIRLAVIPYPFGVPLVPRQ